MPPSDPVWLDQSEERFRLLVESVEDYGIFVLTPEGHVDTWNAGAERLKGYTAAEILGQHFSKFYLEEDVSSGKCERGLEIASRTGRFEEEGWRIRKDGSRFWASVTITALRDDARTLLGFAKVTRDLTERRLAEEEARRFELLIASVKDYGIFILTPEGRIDTWNAGAERLKGYTAAEIIGQHFSVFYPPEVVASGLCTRELEGATTDGRYEDEGWRVRKDGTQFWASVTITALRDPGGVLVGFAKVTRDLTERKVNEERLRALAAETAVLAEKARVHEFQERFIAVLGHDLRNPLAAIEMGASLLRRQSAPESPQLRIVEKIGSSARRMARMIQQILDLTRSRLAGGIEVVPRPMDATDMLRHVIDELRVAHPARAVLLDADALPGQWDRDRLEQVFSNLIGNALQHGAPGEPIAVRGFLEPDRIVVEVHNLGPSIAPGEAVELFNPFRRGTRDSRSAAAAGLGLGLYISQEIILAHGGTIVVHSNDIAGTTFRVTLPRTMKLA